MEHASQASIAATRKRRKPEESLPSCSGKISRTEEQYGSPWELLPAEMVVSIFKHLSNQDLLACRVVCKRFVIVIDALFLLDKAKAFCRQFSQPPDPALFGQDRYNQVLRPWLAAFVTAQRRLADAASDDLPFPDSKREETERQASSKQTEQVQAIKSSQIPQLDRLTGHSEFPKAHFFIHAKTLHNAESLYLQEKISHSFSGMLKTVCFSPDGRGLLIPFGNTLRFIVLEGNDNVIPQNDESYGAPVRELRFSPNGRSLLIGFWHSIMIMGLDGDNWVQKGEIRWDYFKKPFCFSPDSNSLAAVLRNSIRIMSRDAKGNWGQHSEILLSHAEAVCFSPNGSLAISKKDIVWIMGRDEKGNWVQNSMIRDGTFTFVESVCFSPDGDSLAISTIGAVQIMRSDGKGDWVQNIVIPCAHGCSVCFSPDGGSLAISDCNAVRNAVRKAVLIMRSDEKGNWVQNFMIPCGHGCSVCFSPDGRNLMLKPVFYPRRSLIVGFDRANSRVCRYETLHHNKNAVCFSPDGGGLAIGCGSTTWIMGLDSGKWVKKACIPNEGSVMAVYFSPDSRNLAIILSCGSRNHRNSRVKIYEIKTGAKVLKHRDNQFLKSFFPLMTEEPVLVIGKE